MKRRKPVAITEVTKNLRGKTVLVRASLNAPTEDGEVTNHFRITRAIPTISCLAHAGAKVVVLAHIGRDPNESLEPVYEALKERFPITFLPSLERDLIADAVTSMADGDVLLLENVRSDAREKENNDAFAQMLASYADIYVNDAFADSHREHASIVGIPKYLPGYMGQSFKEEYLQLSFVEKPKHPAFFVTGGAKFETKRPLIERFLTLYDYVFVGGALANDFLKAKGHEVGTSLVSESTEGIEALLHNEKLLLPADVVVEGPQGVRTVAADAVEKDEKIVDVGPDTIAFLRGKIMESKTILWNGPLGFYEGGYDTATKQMATLIAESPGYSVVGGGDTIAAIESLGLNDRFCFLSTAGGAMMTFLEKGTLPGIEALLESKKK